MNNSQDGLQPQRPQMLNVLGIGKAAPIYPRRYRSEIIHRAGVGRWRARVFDAEGAFRDDFVRALGGDERAVARDDLLLTFEVHPSGGVAGGGWGSQAILFLGRGFRSGTRKLNSLLMVRRCRRREKFLQSELGQSIVNDIFRSGRWNNVYSVVCPL